MGTKILVCKICGGKLVMDNASDSATCDSCGISYQQEKLKKMMVELSGPLKIDGPVQVDGIQSKEKQVQNADTFITLKDLAHAKEIYLRLTDQYPDDYRGWWGQLRVMILEHSKFDRRHDEAKKYFDHAIQFAPADKATDIRRTYSEMLQVYKAEYEQILSACNDRLTHMLEELDVKRAELESQTKGKSVRRVVYSAFLVCAGFFFFGVHVFGVGMFLGTIACSAIGIIGLTNTAHNNNNEIPFLTRSIIDAESEVEKERKALKVTENRLLYIDQELAG